MNHFIFIKKSNKHFYAYILSNSKILFSCSTNSKIFKKTLFYFSNNLNIKYLKIYVLYKILYIFISSRNLNSLRLIKNYPFKSRIKFLINLIKNDFLIV
ncbi:hypothetical protein ACWNYH_00770 [Candidatus Vidania fulgoroideorum]